MEIPREALELENRSLGRSGEHTLPEAYEILAEAWREGNHDRETGLHLMFLAWYLLVEPEFLTGLDEGRHPHRSLRAMSRKVHKSFKPSIKSDAGMLFAVGLMAHLFPYVLGKRSKFEKLARRYRSLYRSLAPEGISPDVFAGRGAYGEYFRHQAKSADGY